MLAQCSFVILTCFLAFGSCVLDSAALSSFHESSRPPAFQPSSLVSFNAQKPRPELQSCNPSHPPLPPPLRASTTCASYPTRVCQFPSPPWKGECASQRPLRGRRLTPHDFECAVSFLGVITSPSNSLGNVQSSLLRGVVLFTVFRVQ